MHARVLRRLLICLLALTGVALVWNALGMNTRLVIDGRSPFPIAALDDHGGASVAVVARTGAGLALDCRIKAGHEWHYCELQVQLGKEGRGVDLSRFDRLRLWVTASGPQARQRVRLTLSEVAPTRSTAGADAPRKVNQLLYEPAAHPDGYEVPLSRFTVAQQVDDAHPLTFDLDTPEFGHVALLAFAPGPTGEPGLYRIQVHRIELRGKLIPASTLRLGIIVAWMVSVIGYLVVDGLLARSRLRLSSASQVSLRRLNESLRLETRSLAEIARTDALTGALNRKGLADELMRLVRMGGETIFPLTLVFIDIDHFRRVNDVHGRDIGDQVMRGLADLVRSAVQRDDLFARWGGEELLLVFRNTPGVEGRNIAERLRERIAGARWPDGLHVTCSFGVAEWHRGEDLGEGIRRADEAMYRAKQNGRDRVELELEASGAPESQAA